MKKTLLSLLLLLSVIITKPVFGQDPQYSQFYAAPLYLNPALTGSGVTGGPRIIMNYRNQWPSIPGTFESYAVSYDQFVPMISGGAGVIVTTDQAGEGNLRSTEVSGLYAYDWSINRKSSLRAGLQFTYAFKSIDFFRLTLPDQIDPQSGVTRLTQEKFPKNSVSYPDFSGGLIYFQKLFYLGFTAHHLNEPSQSLLKGASNLPRKWSVQGGGSLPINKKMSIAPAFLLRNQDIFYQIDLGMYLLYEPVMLGLYWRSQDALILLLGIKKDNVTVGYSYDLTTSDLRLAGASSHELSFSIEFPPRVPLKRYRRLSCPSFGK